jgi:hypothetical protein
MRARAIARLVIAAAVAASAAAGLGVVLLRAGPTAEPRAASAATPPRPTASPAPPSSPGPSFTVLTFNAGLVIGVLPLARERVPVVVDRLAREPADLVCAQELWQEEHWSAVAARLASRLPHTHRPPPAARSSDEACSTADVDLLEACHRASCGSARPAQLASCMIGRCAHLAASIDPGCLTCLLREPWSSIAAVRQACAPETPPIARPAAVPRAEGSYAFGGSGARAPGAVVVAGDLNTGPALPGRTSAKLPAHYQRLVSAGLSSPYASGPDARCTYCFANPLVGGGAGGLLIDHVLLRGWTGAARARRVLDQPVAIEVDGEARTTPPSDHYGVAATLSR